MYGQIIKLDQKMNASIYHKILPYYFQNILKSPLELKLMKDNFLDIFQDFQTQKIFVNHFTNLKKSNYQLLITNSYYFDINNNVHNNIVVILNNNSYDFLVFFVQIFQPQYLE